MATASPPDGEDERVDLLAQISGGHDFIYRLFLRLPGLLVGLTFHEFAHALASDRCGDPTPRHMGRLTLNPLAHLDPLGALCLLFAPIGWAKPVPVNPSFWRRRHAEYLVSLAGVTTNLLLAVVTALLLRGLWALNVQVPPYVEGILLYAVIINVGLMVFNLLPIHPLDGSHVMRELLPWRHKEAFDHFSRYGPFVLMGVVFLNYQTGILSLPINAIVRFVLFPDLAIAGWW
jgi:Zn-dependent protease